MYVAEGWKDLHDKIKNEAASKCWSNGWAGNDLTKKELETLHMIVHILPKRHSKIGYHFGINTVNA